MALMRKGGYAAIQDGDVSEIRSRLLRNHSRNLQKSRLLTFCELNGKAVKHVQRPSLFFRNRKRRFRYFLTSLCRHKARNRHRD